MDLLSIVLVILYLMVTGIWGIWVINEHEPRRTIWSGRSAYPVIMALSYGATFISTSAIVGRRRGGKFWHGLAVADRSQYRSGNFYRVCFGQSNAPDGHHLDAHTFPELIARRYNSRFLHVACALIIFIFMPLYAMAVMVGGAEFIGPIFRISYDTGLYIIALIVALRDCRWAYEPCSPMPCKVESCCSEC